MFNDCCFYSGNISKTGRSKMIAESLDQHTKLLSADQYNNKLILFLMLCKSIINSDRLIVINRQSLAFIICALPLILYKKYFNSFVIIYDMWEFYTFTEHKSFNSRIGTFLERIIICLANKIIVCNYQRRRLLSKYFPKKNIYVVENIRLLSNSKNKSSNFFDTLYLSNFEYNFILTNSFSLERNDVRLLDIFSKSQKCSLTFLGASTEYDNNFFLKHITKHKIDNVFQKDSVPIDDLGDVITNFDFGVVNYSSFNLNNKYCASGKLFEYMSLGLPVLISNNPTLIDVVMKFKCGLYTDDINFFISKSNIYKDSLSNIDLNDFYSEHLNKINSILC